MKVTAPSLSALPQVRHAFFTREGGVSEGIYASLNGGVGSNDDQAHVAENRARMAHALGAARAHFLTPYQIHSADVVTIDQPWNADARPRADAVVTATPGLALGISTADCGPILFSDPVARVIGAAHAGWRGAFTGVLENTIAAMEALSARRGDICVALGPMISQPHYEVGPEFVSRFHEQARTNAAFFGASERDGHALFDLPGYVASRLRSAGIAHIEDTGLCTYADPARFFSYRRTTHAGEPDYGRQISAIMLRARDG